MQRLRCGEPTAGPRVRRDVPALRQRPPYGGSPLQGQVQVTVPGQEAPMGASPTRGRSAALRKGSRSTEQARTGRLETATGTSEAGRIRTGRLPQARTKRKIQNKIKIPIQIEVPIEIQTQGQQYRVSPNTGGRRIPEPKGNDRRQRHRGTLTGELGGRGFRGARGGRRCCSK